MALVDSSPRLRSLTQWLSAVWRLLWWLRQQIMRRVRRPPSTSAVLLKGLQPATVRAYQRAHSAFVAYTRRENLKLETPED